MKRWRCTVTLRYQDGDTVRIVPAWFWRTADSESAARALLDAHLARPTPARLIGRDDERWEDVTAVAQLALPW